MKTLKATHLFITVLFEFIDTRVLLWVLIELHKYGFAQVGS